jgi:hypothetical protein
MHHKLAILAILLALGGVGAGVWYALHPPVGLFLAPGATDIQVIDMEAGTLFITYHTLGAAYAWRAAVERNLVQQSWVNPPWWHPGLPDLSYIYRSEFGFGALWYQADLRGEPNIAQITLRCWIERPWWPGISPTVIRPAIDRLMLSPTIATIGHSNAHRGRNSMRLRISSGSSTSASSSRSRIAWPKVTDRLADRDTELVRIDQPVKIAARSHPFIGNPQQVAILTE